MQLATLDTQLWIVSLIQRITWVSHATHTEYIRRMFLLLFLSSFLSSRYFYQSCTLDLSSPKEKLKVHSQVTLSLALHDQLQLSLFPMVVLVRLVLLLMKEFILFTYSHISLQSRLIEFRPHKLTSTPTFPIGDYGRWLFARYVSIVCRWPASHAWWLQLCFNLLIAATKGPIIDLSIEI